VQKAAAETYSTPSLEAAQAYAHGQEAWWAEKPAEAIGEFQRAIQLDANMGRAYAGLATNYANTNNSAEAEHYFDLAMRKSDRMTEREKLRTYGAYYLFRSNYDKAREALTELTNKYPGDDAGQANLAYANFISHNIPRAVELQKALVQRKPDDNAFNRGNLALYEMYSGQFDAAIQQAQATLKVTPKAPFALKAMSMSQFAMGKTEEAAATYAVMVQSGPQLASLGTMGLADIALYEGRNRDAAQILEKGIAADLENKNVSAAAVKLAALAAVQHSAATAERSLKTDKAAAFSAARVLLEVKQETRALEVAKQIGSRPEPEPRALAKLLEGEALLARGNAQEAIQVFQEALKLNDSWIGRMDLGRAYLVSQFYPEASSEFNACIKRVGEATAVFLDDTPSFRYFPPVYYYLGQAQQGLKSDAAKDSYQKFLTMKSKADADDSMVADARKRLAQVSGN